jgi:hypothetical protein
VSEITLDLLARTVLELMRLPKFEDCDVKDLTVPAHELLIECARTIEHFEQGDCTYREAIRKITGWRRISAREIRLFEEFYKDTYLSLRRKSWKAGRIDLNDSPGMRMKQLREWKERNSVPIKACLESNPDFKRWYDKRQSEIDSKKGVKGAEAKKFKKALASPQTEAAYKPKTK